MALQHPNVLTPPPAMFLGGMLVGYSLDNALGLPMLATPYASELSGLLFLIGIMLIVMAVWQLRRAKTTLLPHKAAKTLVTGGVFRLSRNPIYLGFISLYLAATVQWGSLGMAILLVPVVLFIQRHVIAAEEAFHEQQFAEQWAEYQSKVRRWF